MISLPALSLESILAAQRNSDLDRIRSLLAAHGTDGNLLLAAIRREHESAPTVALFRKGMNVVWSALNVAEREAAESAQASSLALNFATALVRAYARPEGGFLEYDRNAWVPPEDMWRTIPWGTAFHGHVLLDVWTRLRHRLPAAEAEFWTRHLERTGAWIFQNPVCASFVFNCGLHLLSLLWRLGETFDRPDWTSWALDTARRRVTRDVDAEGWITGENGGVSGVYQMLGAGFLAQFARECGDPSLQEISRRMLDLHLRFASRELIWPGNFGTRSSCFGPVIPLQIVEEAAAGNGLAASVLRGRGALQWADWDDHTRPLFHSEVWRLAFATVPAAEPAHPQWEGFAGINAAIARRGGFHAGFFNYGKSIWARGFASLSHRTGPIFSTLHSLPTEIEKSKMNLGDTSDWAGFPHVMIAGAEGAWHSQQGLRSLSADESTGLVVSWAEDLLDASGGKGGTARFSCDFGEDTLLLDVELCDLRGAATLDFHLRRAPGNFTGYWLGDEIGQIRSGDLPSEGGQFWDREFAPTATRLAAVQIETRFYTWEVLECPEGSSAVLGLRKSHGLHTHNQGGVRLRLRWPDSLRQGRLRLKFSIKE